MEIPVGGKGVIMTGRLQIKKGYYYIRLNYKDESGRYKDKWIATGLPEKNNKRKAEEMLREAIREHEENPKVLMKAMDMPELIKTWLVVKKGDVRGNSYNSYCETAELHVIPYFEALGLPIQKLEPLHIQGYYTAKTGEGLSSGTLTRHRTIIHGSLDYAMQTLGIIKANPADRVKLPKRGKKRVPVYYTEEQLKRLFLEVEGQSIEAPVKLSATYGLRRSETLGLRWSAIDWKRKKVAVCHTVVRNGKKVIKDDTVKETASFRTMPLTKDMETFLRKLQTYQEQMKELFESGYQENDYICKWDDGKPLDPDYVTSRFKRFLKERKLPHIRFHDLRHSSATLLVNNGYTLEQVKDWLGHASIRSTEIYAHLRSDSKAEMADRVNSLLSLGDEKEPEAESKNSENFSENKAFSA